ncbi:hypothetical protein KUTeg_021334 [Tegillarca granosa]|uniref:SMP-30/Gluconolactonase/LRE-like region domain-containing protein n=1 Tax=Tegillarca granosa TaxID=220873 RepID=A0ABQ9EAJ5_TEGGR|nr:hypothetical protein KUTeg_021334 [Tegillarca granosa]
MKNQVIEKSDWLNKFEITTSENTRWFTGGVFLKDDRLLFADRRNKKIRLYDSSGKLIYQHQLNYEPWDVTVGDTSNKVLVSDNESAYIRTYIISETGIREGSSIKVSDIKSGIATLGDQILCSGGGKVEIINYRGSSLKVLEMGYSEYICVSKAKKQFYCTYDHTVSCTTMNGDEVFVYSHPELTYPKGMAMDNHGNLFICAYSSGNIHVVSEDGKQSVDIVSINVGKITQPYSIAFNSTGEKIFVASYKENEPIEIYEVKYD